MNCSFRRAFVFSAALLSFCLCACSPGGLPRSLDAVEDRALAADFAAAGGQIGMDIKKISDMEKSRDWAGGPLYLFNYEGDRFLLYADMDSTVKSIRQGPLGTDIYSKGYEPYQVSDYLPDSDVVVQVKLKAQDYIKQQLNFPAEAEFPWLDWTERRDRSLYTVSSTVTAKNAAGVKSDFPFELTFDVNDNAYTLVYLNIDGNVVRDDTDSYKPAERKRSGDGAADTGGGAITLVDGELGDYGKKVTMSGFEYINYYVPAGKYDVTNNGIHGWVSVDKDKITRNASGFEETETVMDHEFTEHGEKTQIEVRSGEHIELTASTNITLVPV